MESFIFVTHSLHWPQRAWNYKRHYDVHNMSSEKKSPYRTVRLWIVYVKSGCISYQIKNQVSCIMSLFKNKTSLYCASNVCFIDMQRFSNSLVKAKKVVLRSDFNFTKQTCYHFQIACKTDGSVSLLLIDSVRIGSQCIYTTGYIHRNVMYFTLTFWTLYSVFLSWYPCNVHGPQSQNEVEKWIMLFTITKLCKMS